MSPDFSYERKLWRKGYKVVAGVDEVGRGSFAGPVVAGCVIFTINRFGVLPPAGPAGSSSRPMSSGEPAGTRRDSLRFRHPLSRPSLINDSKKLSSKQREVADKWIRKNALSFGVGTAGVAQINKLGIKKATEIAFRKAIKNCNVQIDFLLIDAFYIPYVKGLRRKNQRAIIKGDNLSVSIAAASIIAKVARDRLMTDLGKDSKYRKYKWGQNKGYGTKTHQEMIKKYGPSRLHRRKFVESWINNSSFSPVR